MLHTATPEFWRNYHSLPPGIRNRADQQFLRLRSNPHHPSLQLKKIGVRDGLEVWSVRVTLSYRAATLQRAGGSLWFWIGNHERYDRLS